MENKRIIQWPGWEITRLIGNGSFGSVYEIQRNLFGNVEKAALKVIHIPQSQSDIDELYNDGFDEESITARFNGYLEDIIREYSLMASLKGNKNVVYCDDVRQIQHEDGIGWDIYIKMELLTPLVKVLGKEVSEEQVINIGIDMCNALVLCKEQNIVHRDIKPQNIFVSKDGVYKLGDFGIAKTAERTTSGTKTGTYKYMAPEVYKSQPYGVAADQYSLGMVLYWLLNERRTPFLPLPSTVKATTVTMEDAARKRRFDGEQIPPPAHGSKQLQAIVLKACAYDPRQRFASAAEMLKALEELKNGSVPASTTVPMGVVTAVVGGAATGELTSGTVGTVGIRRPNGAFDSGLASVVRQGQIRNDQPIGQQSSTYYRTQSAQQANRQYAGAPVAATQIKAEEKKKKRGAGAWIVITAGLAVVIGGVLLLTLGKDRGSGNKNDTDSNMNISESSATIAQLDETLPVQLDWAEWADELPNYVTDNDYEIEERILYRYRNLETTSSTTSDKMDGWELYDTATGNGDYGAWSDWSQTAVSASDVRDVATQNRYRYSDKETTTSSSPNMAGWTLEDTTYSLGDYGAWSDWSTTAVSASETRRVETKTQYQYRDKEYKTGVTESYLSGWTQTGSRVVYGSWGSSQTTTSKPSESDTLRIVDQYVSGYNYYHYCCNYYNGGWMVDSIPYGNTNSTHYHTLHTTSQLPAFNMADQGNRQAYGGSGSGASPCANNFYAWFLDSTEYTYVYQTRSATTVYDYERWGQWSSWSDTVRTSSSTRQVQTRTMYRYCDRPQIATYHFYRWKDWSAWSETAYVQTNSRKVETTTFYRYRDRVKETTYYFRRWTDWSEYSESHVDKSETVEVETKTQYRYKSKAT